MRWLACGRGAYTSIPFKFVIEVPVTGQTLRAEEPFARSAVVARQLAPPGVALASGSRLRLVILSISRSH